MFNTSIILKTHKGMLQAYKLQNESERLSPRALRRRKRNLRKITDSRNIQHGQQGSQIQNKDISKVSRPTDEVDSTGIEKTGRPYWATTVPILWQVWMSSKLTGDTLAAALASLPTSVPAPDPQQQALLEDRVLQLLEWQAPAMNSKHLYLALKFLVSTGFSADREQLAERLASRVNPEANGSNVVAKKSNRTPGPKDPAKNPDSWVFHGLTAASDQGGGYEEVESYERLLHLLESLASRAAELARRQELNQAFAFLYKFAQLSYLPDQTALRAILQQLPPYGSDGCLETGLGITLMHLSCKWTQLAALLKYYGDSRQQLHGFQMLELLNEVMYLLPEVRDTSTMSKRELAAFLSWFCMLLKLTRTCARGMQLTDIDKCLTSVATIVSADQRFWNFYQLPARSSVLHDGAGHSDVGFISNEPESSASLAFHQGAGHSNYGYRDEPDSNGSSAFHQGARRSGYAFISNEPDGNGSSLLHNGAGHSDDGFISNECDNNGSSVLHNGAGHSDYAFISNEPASNSSPVISSRTAELRPHSPLAPNSALGNILISREPLLTIDISHAGINPSAEIHTSGSITQTEASKMKHPTNSKDSVQKATNTQVASSSIDTSQEAPNTQEANTSGNSLQEATNMSNITISIGSLQEITNMQNASSTIDLLQEATSTKSTTISLVSLQGATSTQDASSSRDSLQEATNTKHATISLDSVEDAANTQDASSCIDSLQEATSTKKTTISMESLQEAPNTQGVKSSIVPLQEAPVTQDSNSSIDSLQETTNTQVASNSIDFLREANNTRNSSISMVSLQEATNAQDASSSIDFFPDATNTKHASISMSSLQEATNTQDGSTNGDFLRAVTNTSNNTISIDFVHEATHSSQGSQLPCKPIPLIGISDAEELVTPKALSCDISIDTAEESPQPSNNSKLSSDKTSNTGSMILKDSGKLEAVHGIRPGLSEETRHFEDPFTTQLSTLKSLLRSTTTDLLRRLISIKSSVRDSTLRGVFTSVTRLGIIIDDPAFQQLLEARVPSWLPKCSNTTAATLACSLRTITNHTLSSDTWNRCLRYAIPDESSVSVPSLLRLVTALAADPVPQPLGSRLEGAILYALQTDAVNQFRLSILLGLLPKFTYPSEQVRSSGGEFEPVLPAIAEAKPKFEHPTQQLSSSTGEYEPVWRTTADASSKMFNPTEHVGSNTGGFSPVPRALVQACTAAVLRKLPLVSMPKALCALWNGLEGVGASLSLEEMEELRERAHGILHMALSLRSNWDLLSDLSALERNDDHSWSLSNASLNIHTRQADKSNFSAASTSLHGTVSLMHVETQDCKEDSSHQSSSRNRHFEHSNGAQDTRSSQVYLLDQSGHRLLTEIPYLVPMIAALSTRGCPVPSALYSDTIACLDFMVKALPETQRAYVRSLLHILRHLCTSGSSSEAAQEAGVLLIQRLTTVASLLRPSVLLSSLYLCAKAGIILPQPITVRFLEHVLLNMQKMTEQDTKLLCKTLSMLSITASDCRTLQKLVGNVCREHDHLPLREGASAPLQSGLISTGQWHPQEDHKQNPSNKALEEDCSNVLLAIRQVLRARLLQSTLVTSVL